jgi:hypothetical protein
MAKLVCGLNQSLVGYADHMSSGPLGGKDLAALDLAGHDEAGVDGLQVESSDGEGAVFLSPRQFSRLIREETGESPAKAVERLRVESARTMMEAGRFSADEVARKNGFGNRDRMRRSFLRVLGQPPRVIQHGRSKVSARAGKS